MCRMITPILLPVSSLRKDNCNNKWNFTLSRYQVCFSLEQTDHRNAWSETYVIVKNPITLFEVS